MIDSCQHVLIGRCTNLIDLYRRLGVGDAIRWYRQFTFVEPGGRRSVLRSSWLPAPLHSVPSFLAAHAFTWADKAAIARGLLQFMGGLPPDSEENFADWLKRHGQTHGAVERFWKPVLVSALNEDPERISVHYAAKVFRESFLSSARAGQMGIPSIPLSELYGHAVEYIRARGGEVRLRTSVDAMEPGANGGWAARSGEERFEAAAAVAGWASGIGTAMTVPVTSPASVARNRKRRLSQSSRTRAAARSRASRRASSDMASMTRSSGP